MLVRRLDEEEDAAHVDVEDGREGLDRRLGQTGEAGDGAGVVDDYVDGPAREGVERARDDVPPVAQAGRVGLDRDGADTEGEQGGDVLLGGGGGGVVVDDDLRRSAGIGAWGWWWDGKGRLTSAPCSARRVAVAKPTPLGLPAPVMMASFPERGFKADILEEVYGV